jgi:monoamine oxidase
MPKYIVIGGGISGLYCAHILRGRDREATVTVLEAQSRIGGRLYSVPVTLTSGEVVSVPIGGELIHGAPTRLTRLLSATSIDRVPFFPDTALASDTHGVFDGKTRTWSSWPPSPDPFTALDQEREGDEDAGRSLADAVRLEAEAGGWSSEQTTRVRELLDVIEAKTWSTDLEKVGLWENQRSASLGEVEDEWNYAARSGRGLSDLVDRLARGIDVRLAVSVSHVDYGREGGSDIIVRTADGEELRADRVVVAVPLAVLQAGVISFTPALPPRLTAAMGAIGVGTAIKLVLVVSAPCWPDKLRICFCTNATAPQVWVSPPSLVPSESGTVATVTAFITGKAADALADLTPAEIVDRFLDQADAMFASADESQPVRDRLLGLTLHDWTADPAARGAYSFPSPLPADASSSPQAAFASPFVGTVHDGFISFAGEHAARHADVGTVHGALDAAAHAAAELDGGSATDTPFFADLA